MSGTEHRQCPVCAGWLTWESRFGETTTLVWYASPPWHDHNDNCRIRVYRCKGGHSETLSLRQRCFQGDWEGKEVCFCHPGRKVEVWP